jgi:hypothetical protein
MSDDQADLILRKFDEVIRRLGALERDLANLHSDFRRHA